MNQPPQEAWRRIVYNAESFFSPLCPNLQNIIQTPKMQPFKDILIMRAEKNKYPKEKNIKNEL